MNDGWSWALAQIAKPSMASVATAAPIQAIAPFPVAAISSFWKSNMGSARAGRKRASRFFARLLCLGGCPPAPSAARVCGLEALGVQDLGEDFGRFDEPRAGAVEKGVAVGER